MLKKRLYTLHTQHQKHSTKVVMHLLVPIFYTSQLAHTHDFLVEKLPRVLQTKCFNDKKLPFHEEVKDTELAHMFEHILLEKLCMKKAQLGGRKVTYNGLTSWDWSKDEKGTFHISINSTLKDQLLFKEVLEESADLLDELLHKGGWRN